VATTLFQPVFWSGYQLEERYWHLYWIPAYTSRGLVGLDVTVDPDSGLDFKWVNPTDSYILIQAAADDTNVYFGLYGKKPKWTVKVDDAEVSNRVPPDTKPSAQAEPTLPWGRTLQVESAREGFDVVVKRHVVPADGGPARDLVLKSTYQPARTVTLVGTGGAPAGADVSSIIARIVGSDSAASAPVENRPAGAASASATAQPTAQPTSAPATAQAAATVAATRPPATAAANANANAAAATATPAPAVAPTQPPATHAPTAAPTVAATATKAAPTPTPKTGPNVKPGQ
jgi:hypothetical protein